MILRLPVQFIRYLAVGGTAASLNLASRIFYNLWTSYSVAIVLAHLTGMATTFLLARIYVFPQDHQTLGGRTVLRFCIVQGIALLESLAVSILLADHVPSAFGVRRFDHEIAHMTGVTVAVFTNYFGSKHWTFRPLERSDASPASNTTIHQCNGT